MILGGYAVASNAAESGAALAHPPNSNSQRSAAQRSQLTDNRAGIGVAVPLPHGHGGALERQDACEHGAIMFG